MLLLSVTLALAADPMVPSPGSCIPKPPLPEGQALVGTLLTEPVVTVNGWQTPNVGFHATDVESSMAAIPGFIRGPDAMLYGTPLSEVRVVIDGVPQIRSLR
jgi:hypothetical protein